MGLDDLIRGDVQVQVARLLVLQTGRDIVEEHGVNSDEGRESLSDADRRYVIRR